LLRKVFFLLVFVLDTVICGSLAVLFSYIPGCEKKVRKAEEYWARIAVLASGVRLNTRLPELDENSNYIFICNHQSHLDTPILLALLKDYQPRFLAKESLFRIPFLGQGMYKTGHFSVNRDNARQGMRDLQRAAENLDQGESLLVFPEGTRSKTGEVQEFYTGGFIIALKTWSTPIVPVVLEGTKNVLPKGSISLGKERDVYIMGREPIYIHQEYGVKERERLKKDMQTIIEQMYSELREWMERNKD